MVQFISGMDNMLAAYVNEYGRNLANELTGETAQADIVEGEVVVEAEEEAGRTGEEGVGVHTQMEKEVTNTVLDNQDEDE